MTLRFLTGHRHVYASALLAASTMLALGAVSGASAQDMQFPLAGLGSLNVEKVTAQPPYFRTVKPPFARAVGKVLCPAGEKLQVEASYQIVEHPDLLKYLDRPEIISLKFKSLPIDDSFVARLRDFKYVRKLDIDDTDITDGCFQYLSALPALEELNVSQTSIKGSGFRFLANCKKLKVLHANHIVLSDESMKLIGAACTLRVLDLAYTQIDDNALAHLAGLSDLLELEADHNRFGDRGLRALQKLTKLKYLDVTHTNVSTAGLLTLKNCPLKSLRALEIKKSAEDELKLRQIFRKVNLQGEKQDFKIDPEVFRPLH
jgi:Leucine-rich repeat (LRR) protein